MSAKLVYFHLVARIFRASVWRYRGQTTHKTCRLSIPSSLADYGRITRSRKYNLLFSLRSRAIPRPISRGVARDNHFHIAELLATQNRWSGRRGLRREPRVWSSKGSWVITGAVQKKKKKSDAGLKLGFISITKTRSVFPVVIGHFGNSLSSSDTSELQRKSFISLWQQRAEKKNFVWLVFELNLSINQSINNHF